jgi:hypothetical protein
MHGTKESFILESALKRGEYIVEDPIFGGFSLNEPNNAFHFAFVQLGGQQQSS